MSAIVTGMGSILAGAWYEVLEPWDYFRRISLEHSIYRKKMRQQAELWTSSSDRPVFSNREHRTLGPRMMSMNRS
jgi:hypothetical protein